MSLRVCKMPTCLKTMHAQNVHMRVNPTQKTQGQKKETLVTDY